MVCVRVCVYTCVDVCLCVHVCGVCLCVCVSLRTLAEKAREFNISLYLSFVDLRKAYGSVNREVLWLLLERKYQFPGKLISILRALHQGNKGAVRAYGKISEEFDISNGVIQGAVLGPVLFTLFFDAITTATLSQRPGSGVRMLCNLGDSLVVNRRKSGRKSLFRI